MSVTQVIRARERDLGGFVVRRVLPSADRQMVGPFIFFDHLGPTVFAPGEGIDVRPHPHISLATVTYLFSGSLMHRDSLGSVREIRPGDVNWMTAGRGIVHSERTPPEARASGPHVHGIQSWVALPDGEEDLDASFIHYAAADLPKLNSGGIELSVIAGSAFGLTSPVRTQWPTLYLDTAMAQGASFEVPAEHAERAVYVVRGTVSAGEITLHEGQLGILATAVSVTLHALAAVRVMLLGGERFPTPRYIDWNFVASSRERIERAKQRWQAQEFPRVPGETEFIPLPTV
jgi:redox-sensitive bicupin YhaK (pirin superfamily)